MSYFTRCFGTPHGTGEKEVKVKTTGRVVALAGRFIKCGFKPCGSTRITGSFRAGQTKAKYGKTTKIPGRKCFAHHQKGCDPSSEMPILAKSSQTPFLRLLKVLIIMSIDYNRLEVKGFQLESLELVVRSILLEMIWLPSYSRCPYENHNPHRCHGNEPSASFRLFQARRCPTRCIIVVRQDTQGGLNK